MFDVITEEIVNPTLTVTRKREEFGTWEYLAKLIKDGYAYRAIDVGDTISCKMKDGKELLIDVIGLNVYDENEAIFCFHDLYCEARMNDTATNAGGFLESKMYKETLTEIYENLPDDLRDVITPMRICQNLTEGGVSEGYANLWLPSFYEVFGEVDGWEYIEEGNVQFPYFKNPRNRARRTADEFKYNMCYWLRDYYTGNATTFNSVNSSGAYYNSITASNTYGVLPCFKISKNF